AVQHSNLFNRDHVATVAYTTSPDSPSGAKVDLYSLGYRLPLYGLGDSLDFIYGKSNVSSGQTLAVNSTLNITGRGEIYALRWN
ncbi:ShlB/FhaC/HecB family hemolysin secretion/activation protein, partial [Pseudomonas putida]|nr:ShlB/FhaC/HecB family hemolysin secretion/activation protein [Pseudomonas putida]